jgi:hypothetical protein
MKRSIYLALTALIISGLSACTSYNYYTAAINKTNLSSYHTFAWMPPAKNGDKAMVNNEADAKIKDAATSALVAKGLRLSQSNPDLVVSYTTVVGRGARTNYYTPNYYGGWGGYSGYGGFGLGFGYGFGWGWGGYYRPYYYSYGAPFAYGGPTYAEKEHFKEGTLIIDLIDPRSRRIVWRGFGVGEVHKNRQKDVEDLPKVVNGVIAQLQLTPAYASR